MSTGDLPAVALCVEYPLALRGGVSVLVEELIEGLTANYRVWLVSPEDPAELEKHPAFKLLAGHIRSRFSCHPPKKAWSEEASTLVAKLVKEDVKLVHFHCGGVFSWGNRWPGASLPHFCARAGIRSVWSDHSTETALAGFAYHGRRRWLSRALAPLARAGKVSQMRAVAAEVAVSDHNKSFLATNFPGGSDKLRRIYHSRLDAAEPSVPAAAPREKMILAAGHIAYRKGQDVLVRAFLEVAPAFPEWRLVLLGHEGADGCQHEIEQLCAAHPDGKRVELAGMQSRPQEWMARAAVFAQPSLEEALGLALQEALFAGCPVVASKVGGIPEVIDDGQTGLLVPAGDPAALAAALRRLMGDEALRDAMSARGPAAILAKGMTRERMIDAHRSLYRDILTAT